LKRYECCVRNKLCKSSLVAGTDVDAGTVVVEGKPVVEIVEPYSGILYPSNPVKPVAPVNPRYPSKEGIVVVVVVGKAAPETETSVAADPRVVVDPNELRYPPPPYILG
jgi:hypothetical protein